MLLWDRMNEESRMVNSRQWGKDDEGPGRLKKATDEWINFRIESIVQLRRHTSLGV